MIILYQIRHLGADGNYQMIEPHARCPLRPSFFLLFNTNGAMPVPSESCVRIPTHFSALHNVREQQRWIHQERRAWRVIFCLKFDRHCPHRRQNCWSYPQGLWKILQVVPFHQVRLLIFMSVLASWVTLYSLGLAAYIYSLDGTTTWNYLAFVTSSFGDHSLISTIQVAQSIIGKRFPTYSRRHLTFERSCRWKTRHR